MTHTTRQRSWRSHLAAIGFTFAIAFLLAVGTARASLLSDYVAQPDPSYGYTPTSVISASAYDIHTVEMASQTWPAGSGGTVWKHAIAIVVPKTVISPTVMMMLGSGDNTAPLAVPASQVQLAVQIALASNSVVAVVGQLPNQPLFHEQDPNGYFEDTLVAYTWSQAMATGDYTLPAYLPMTKAAVRAMDTVQAYLPAAAGKSVGDFVVMGFSKRGAVTWLTAAIDSRVRAFAPGVFDLLNMAPQMEHHYSAYGFYAPAVVDYVNFDIVRRLRTPEGQTLLKVIDPYSYRDALTKPKFLINSSGDQFFLPDSARFYLSDLQGETRIRYVPNTDHTLSKSAGGTQDALLGLLGWYHSILLNTQRANVSWSQADGRVVVRADQPVIAARRWMATNPNARDFRRELIGEAWSTGDLTPTSDGSYMIDLVAPATGWSATFVELVFAGPAGVPQTYSTPIFITPDTLPFTVTDPLGRPKDVDYWKKRVNDEMKQGDGPTASYFPFPVLGRYMNSLSDASSVFASKGDPAMKQCLATRLNIATHDLGWYTELGSRDKKRHLWTDWQSAYDAYLFGRSGKAADICEHQNEQ